MRYYIVTSSLNIDNILSTECISPIAFYAQRNFGYKTFNVLHQLDNSNNILLFSEIPNLTINDLNFENYPAILQLDDNEQTTNAVEVGGIGACKVFSVNDTIRITPINCKVLFFTDKALNLTYQNCLSSKSNKLIQYYKFEILSPSKFSLDALIRSVNTDKLHKDSVRFLDNIFDRIKGFIAGYYIGSQKELTPEVAKVVSIAIKIANIINAKINNRMAEYAAKQQFSKRKVCTSTNYSALDKELNDLETELAKIDPSKTKASRLWRDKIAKNWKSEEEVTNLLKEFGVYNEAKEKIISENKIVLYKKSNTFLTEDEYLDYLTTYVESLIEPISVNLANQIVVKKNLSLCVETQSPDTTKLFNFVLERFTDFHINQLRTNRSAIVTFFGRALGEFYGAIWKESAERKYWGSLKHNIDIASPFNLQEIDNIVLQSLAAFILKGEDYETLVEYLAINAVPVYKYAIAFWGMSVGYVKISRPLLEKEVNIPDFYSQIYKLTTGSEFLEKLEKQTISNKLDVINIVNKIKNHKDYIEKKHSEYCKLIIDRNLSNWDEIYKLSQKPDGWKKIIKSIRPKANKKLNKR